MAWVKSTPQSKLLRSLLDGKSIDDALAYAGIPKKTYYWWRVQVRRGTARHWLQSLVAEIDRRLEANEMELLESLKRKLWKLLDECDDPKIVLAALEKLDAERFGAKLRIDQHIEQAKPEMSEQERLAEVARLRAESDRLTTILRGRQGAN